LLRASDGALYGTTWFGGTNGQGTVYRINEDGSGYQALASFLPARTRQTPRAPLLQGSDRRLYCATEDSGSTNFGSIFSIERNGGEFRLLHDFGVVTNDGRIPNGLCEASDGLLYGTTQLGGTNGNGTIFQVSQTGAGYTVLRSFLNSTDGSSCRARLIEGSDGWLYGCNNLGGNSGRGTIFKLQKGGSGFAVLWHFGAVANDGAAPQGELLEGPDGALYGTTRALGAASRGAVFKINTDGSGYTNLHHFTGSDDGQNPQGGLIAGRDGVLYGTTAGGSSGGTIFALNPDGSEYRVLRTFGSAGNEPRTLRGRLAEGPAGLLYGTTYSGGTNANGTVFSIKKDGTDFRVLWHFGLGSGDGRNPVAGPTLLDDGTLAGSTEAGGDLGFGTFWRLDAREVLLSIERQGGNALIRWPTTGTSDQLEAVDELPVPGTAWNQVPAAVVTNANEYEVNVPLTGTERFLRVRREWK
jgi:uncharacterized repeat protein (TIGR03803 family)